PQLGRARRSLPVGRELAPADGAQPCKESGLAAPGVKLAHCDHERGLHDFLRDVRVVHASQREAEQAWKERLEKTLERRLVPGQHAADETAIVKIVGHIKSGSPRSAKRFSCERPG